MSPHEWPPWDPGLFRRTAGWLLEQEARALGLDFEDCSLGDGLDVGGFVRLLRLIRRSGVQLIHTHLNRAALWGTLAARLSRIPVLATVHGIGATSYYRWADQLLAVSSAVADHLKIRGGNPRVEILPNPVEVNFQPNPSRSEAIRRPYEAQGANQLLLVVGKLHPNKGQRLAIEALALMPPSIHLLLVGDGPDRTSITRLCVDRCVQKRVHLLGIRTDVADLMGAVEVVLVPSIVEAFSLAAAESLLCGTPVVAADTGGLPEVLEENGTLVPRRSPQEWADCCLTVLGDLDRHRARAAAGRIRILAKHNSDSVVGATIQHYNRLLSTQ